MVPEVSSVPERPAPMRAMPLRPPQFPGLVFQCAPLFTDSLFDVRQVMQTPSTANDQAATPLMFPQPSSPGAYLPPNSPFPVMFVQPVIAASPVPFLPNSSGGFVRFDPGFTANRQVPTAVMPSGVNTVSTATPSTSSTSTFTSGTEWLSSVTSHNVEPLLQDLPFLSRRESSAMQATVSESTGSSHRERPTPAHALSLALPSQSDLVQHSEPTVTSPACPSTPILSQCPLTSSNISYLFGNTMSGMAALGKRSSDTRSPVAGTLLQPPSQRPRTIELNERKLRLLNSLPCPTPFHCCHYCTMLRLHCAIAEAEERLRVWQWYLE